MVDASTLAWSGSLALSQAPVSVRLSGTDAWVAARAPKSPAGSVGVFPRDDGRRLYVPALHGNAIAVIDTATEEAPAVWSAVTGPRAVAFVR